MRVSGGMASTTATEPSCTPKVAVTLASGTMDSVQVEEFPCMMESSDTIVGRDGSRTTSLMELALCMWQSRHMMEVQVQAPDQAPRARHLSLLTARQ